MAPTKKIIKQQPLSNKQREARARRNRNRRENKRANNASGLYESKNAQLGNMATSYMNVPRGVLTRYMHQAKGKLTPAGLAFLKCAFAPVDFADTMVTGIPDNNRESILVSKYRFIGNFTVSGASTLTIVLIPVPGVAYAFTAAQPIVAATTLGPVFYSSARNTLTNGQPVINTQNVTKFRMVSNHCEVINTTQMMNTAGSISVWKAPINVANKVLTTGNVCTVNGLESINSSDYRGFDGALLTGAYTAAYSNGKFEWVDIVEGQTSLPTIVTAGTDFGQFTFGSTQFGEAGIGYPGWDNNMQTTIVKITNPSANPQSFRFKTFQCVEYTTNPGSLLFPYSSESPMHDPLALEMYNKIIRELPVAVVYADNENFWMRVLDIIRRVSGSLAILPGPYGMAAGGVSAVSTALQDLMM